MIGNLIWNTKSASFSGLGGGEVVVTRVRTTWHFEACFLISWHFNASWEKGQRFLPILIDFHFKKHSFSLHCLPHAGASDGECPLCLGRAVGSTGRPCRFASRATSAADTFNSLKELHCHCKRGVQPVCSAERGALGSAFSNLCSTRNPPLCHLTLARAGAGCAEPQRG